LSGEEDNMSYQHRHLSSTSGAVAAAASIISGLVGTAATLTAPHGFHRVALALHLAHQPMLVRIAPAVATFAVIAASVAGLFRLYAWRQEVNQSRCTSR
jgi:hypothetical protein